MIDKSLREKNTNFEKNFKIWYYLIFHQNWHQEKGISATINSNLCFFFFSWICSNYNGYSILSMKLKNYSLRIIFKLKRDAIQETFNNSGVTAHLEKF